MVNKYLVKFKNNPQGDKMLMREYVATMLAQQLGIPTVPCEIVYIPERFILETGLDKYKFEHGNQFASLYIENCIGLWLHPEKNHIQNRHILAGIIVFDYWLRNQDRDESNILLQSVGQSHYYIHMIDHGNCYPSKKALFKLLEDPSKLELSEVHKWCISMVDDQTEMTYFLQKIINCRTQLIWDIIQSIPDDWKISDREKGVLQEYCRSQTGVA